MTLAANCVKVVKIYWRWFATDNTINLFAEIEKPSPESLFVIHNENIAKMSVAEIFDAKRFNAIKAVSYVSSPKFFADTIKDFDSVIFILGIDNADNLSKFRDELTQIINSTDQIKFFNDLPDTTKNLIVDNKIQIRYGKQGVMIHDKIYLLSNENTGDYRVIIGSANFSKSAFDNDNKNFENIRIDDSKNLYEIYSERFDYLLKQTNDYIPEICRRNYKDKRTILTVTPDTNFELLIDKIATKNIPIVITQEQFDTNSNYLAQVAIDRDNAETARKVIEVIVEAKDKNGNYKLKPPNVILSKKNILREIFHKIVKRKTNATTDIRDVLLIDNNYKLYRKISDTNEGKIYSRQINTTKIKSTLEKINLFTKAYYDFAVTSNDKIPAKVYELILYAFTAPFIWKIRQKCAMTYDRSAVADIPMFCVIGWISGSGKTNALQFVSTLLGQVGGGIYDYSRELDGAGTVYDLIKSNNLMPIFADEISSNFFKRNISSRKGEDMIKSLANEVPTAPTGTLIGTTNLSDFSTSGQIIRRIYYLEVSSKFNVNNKIDSAEYLRNIYDDLNDELFQDFTYRFSNAINNNEEIFKIEDFLMFTRKIFLNYYSESGLKVPDYFPREIFTDYASRKVKTWRNLFLANRNCFIDKGDTIQVNIDEIFRNSNNVKQQKERLINFLDETCIASDFGIGVNWFLKKEEFYRFIEYKTSRMKNVKTTIKNIFS